MKVADVSVIIPCYKSKDTVWRAVESVYHQTLRPKEVILVDDCSPDDTLNTLYEIRDFYPTEWVKVISLDKNLGPGSARNKGWDMASGKYIAFLDSDDSWHPEKIEIQYGWMIRNAHVSLSGHKYIQIHHDKNCIDDLNNVSFLEDNVEFKKVSKANLIFTNVFSTITVMVRSDIPFRFEDGKRYSEDYQLWLEIAYSGLSCCFSNANLAYIYKAPYGEDGLSSNLWKMEIGELHSILNLKNKGYIGYLKTLLFCIFSLSKYVRRLLLIGI